MQEILTNEFRTPEGTMRLNAVQAIALYEVLISGGLFGPIKVGGGKTLLTLLVAAALGAKRPVLLLPAALIEKTRHEREVLGKHWRLPTNLQVISYEMMGRVSYAEQLNYIQPDVIIADEVHRLKNHRAGVTRRVSRYMKERPETKFAGVSGTIMKNSLKDFSHILRWALKDKSPIPRAEDEVSMWADALDEKVNPIARRRPGALFLLGPRPPEASDALSAVRQIFQRRLLDTPGVVASGKDDAAGASLLVRALEYEVAEVTDGHFKNIKETWTTPDGWMFSEAIELWRHCRSLALGFHGIWDPRPPVEWLEKRKGWAQFVRETLAHSRTLDTELQVAQFVSASGGKGRAPLEAWREVRDTFTPQPRPVWHDDSALKACEYWMHGHKGIVWCEHVFFAEELAKRTGALYYGADGLAAGGESIVDVKPGKAIIASIQANSTGRNLQMFSENLITSPPPGAAGWEQLLGRTHRFGQEADTVTVDVLLGCKEHHDAVMRAIDAARASADTMGHDQKILLADVVFPESLVGRRGARWQ